MHVISIRKLVLRQVVQPARRVFFAEPRQAPVWVPFERGPTALTYDPYYVPPPPADEDEKTGPGGGRGKGKAKGRGKKEP